MTLLFRCSIVAGGLSLVLLCGDSLPANDPRSAATAEPAAVSPAEVSARIDKLFAEAWAAQGLTPAPLTDDATFLRRVLIDLTGAIPEVGEIRSFLADGRADKRAAKVSEVLSRPQHAQHLAHVWRQVLLPRNVPDSTALAFESWLQTRFRDHAPYDELVREILLAEGTVSRTPQALYFAALETKPEQLASSTSRAFLGTQIRCAECHDHPFTDWTQDDFWSYAALFAQVSGPGGDSGATTLTDMQSGEVQHPKTKQTVAPAFLDRTAWPDDRSLSRRARATAWMVADENPYFARAAVNRAWWLMFGRGLVHPVDDLGAHNPATHPEVLDLLTADFIAHGHDLRRTLEILAGTELYQRVSEPVAGDDNPFQSYASMPVRSLSARQVYESLLRASGRREPIDPNAGFILTERQLFLSQVEAPTQEPTEFQGGIPQALALLNGPFVHSLTNPLTGDLVAALVDSPFLTDDQRLETLYLSTVSREPEVGERELALSMIAESQGDKAQAWADILWALLNSTEFIVNR